MRNAHWKADAVLLGLTALWGLSFVIVKDALRDVHPFAFLAARYWVAAAVAVAWARGRIFLPANLKAGGVLSIFLFLGFALQTAGLRHTTASRSAFITGLSVLLVPLIQIALLRRSPRLSSWVGVSLCLLGLYVFAWGGEVALPTDVLYGDGLTLLGAGAFAFHIFFMSHFGDSSDAVGQVAVQMTSVALCSSLLAVGTTPSFEFSAEVWIAAAFCGAVVSTVAVTAQAWAQARTQAVRAAVIFTLEPLFAAGFAAIFTAERLTLAEGVGGALILAGVLTSELAGAWLDRQSRDAL